MPRGYRDASGFTAPAPLSSNQRKLLPEGFATGPAVGTRFPDFELRDASGTVRRLHEDRGNSKAAVVFFRSAVW